MTAIQFLAGWTVRSAILILAAATWVWLLRTKSPAIRLAIWTALLGCSLAIPALMLLPKFPIVVLRSPALPSPAKPAITAGGSAIESGAFAAPNLIPAADRSVAAKPFNWARLAPIVYAMVAGVSLLRLFTGLIVSLRIRCRSDGTGMVEDGIEIRESRDVASPAAVGIIRPAILLPLDWREWDASKLGAVLAHERSHVRRRDPAVQFISAFHRALLWASPASWLLHRSLVRSAEEVSDDDAVAAACDRASYAEILLEFMRRGTEEASWPRVAMARYDRPENRIRRILNSTATSQGISRRGIVAVVMLAAPLAYLAAAAYPQSAPQPSTPAPVASGPSVSELASEPPAAPESPRPEQQSTAAKLPQFEVASITHTVPNVPHLVGARIYPGGRLEMIAVPLKALVAIAFGLPEWEISGGEAWTGEDTYDIEANPPENLRSSIKSLRYSWYEIRDPQLRAMLQALLIDRFQLQFHRGTKTGDMYLLKQSGKTLRLKPVEIENADTDSTGSSGFESVGYAGGQWDISNAGMPYLAKFASSFVLHVPVLDQTGLTGLYHYRQAVPDAEPKYTGDQSESFENFLSEMGLKLERTKGPVETLVIDSAARPTPN